MQKDFGVNHDAIDGYLIGAISSIMMTVYCRK